MATSGRFRFRPRFVALPWLVLALGLALLATVPLLALDGPSRSFALATGAAGPLLALLYLRSPAWQLVVEVGDAALLVHRGAELRLSLPWTDVVRVIASPTTHTLHVDGGTPERRFLLPGPGAPGPYRIERQHALYDAILARVPEDRVTLVELLESA
ncbi:MAG: hypothetical protein EXR73_14655 [Myxococcales bacterium]|nr:hypothetical protein [Myxococcales bacterium]